MTNPGGVEFRNVSFTPPASAMAPKRTTGPPEGISHGRPVIDGSRAGGDSSRSARSRAGIDAESTAPSTSLSQRTSANPKLPRPILDDISLTLEPGTTTALLGRSGSGKTTLLRTVNGLVLPTSGFVTVNGRQITNTTSQRELRDLRHTIGYVIQESGLYPHMTIERNIALPLELAAKSRIEQKQRAAELLSTVGLDPATFAHRHPHELSGGQRQRVGLARALSSDPALLLLDEPFGALDPLTRAEMQTMLRDLLGTLHKTALIVTHDLQEAIFLAHRVLFLNDGRIVADLSAHAVLTSPIPAVAEYVHAVNRFEPAA